MLSAGGPPRGAAEGGPAPGSCAAASASSCLCARSCAASSETAVSRRWKSAASVRARSTSLRARSASACSSRSWAWRRDCRVRASVAVSCCARETARLPSTPASCRIDSSTDSRCCSSACSCSSSERGERRPDGTTAAGPDGAAVARPDGAAAVGPDGFVDGRVKEATNPGEPGGVKTEVSGDRVADGTGVASEERGERLSVV